MRRDALAWLLVMPALLTGCGTLDGWSTRHHPPAPPQAPTDAARVAAHLATLNALANGNPAAQAEITERARLDFVNSPTSSHELHYALILASPGHAGTDLEGAQQLLGSLLATPDRLSKDERALARVVYGDVERLLDLQAQLRLLTKAQAQANQERDAETARRLQTLAADNARLRKELQDAQTKLEAIAELEKALATRHGEPGGKP